ncbi:MAG: hypothetical protein WCR45_04875 [Bacteroidaceae bacterium]|nr:hypothetical protein [Bacteroidaceae bacterium]
MKKTLLISILFGMATLAYGQTGDHRLSYSTTIGTGLPISTPSKTPFTWQISSYYNITPRLAIGAGTGLSIYEKTLLPLFADVKFKITKARKITPYINCEAGYSFALTKETNGGFLLSPTIGIEYAVSKKARLLFGVGYELQELQRLKHYQDKHFTSEFQEQLSHNSLMFKVGVIF